MQKSIYKKIAELMPELSKGHKLIGQYILDNYNKAAFMTAAKLGITVGVSESTVVRFATEIGFDGYPSLQRAMQDLMKNKLTAVQRIEVTSDQIGNHDILEKVLNLDIERIRKTLEETSREDFNKAVDIINNASVITSYSIHYTKLYDLFHKVGATIIVILLMFTFLMLLTNISLLSLFRFFTSPFAT